MYLTWTSGETCLCLQVEALPQKLTLKHYHFKVDSFFRLAMVGLLVNDKDTVNAIKYYPNYVTLLCTGQQIVRCMSGDHTPAHWKSDHEIAIEQKSHMNNLPVPEGSWQEYYNKRNSKWNIQLGISTVFLLVTAFVVSHASCFLLTVMTLSLSFTHFFWADSVVKLFSNFSVSFFLFSFCQLLVLQY